MYGFLLRGIPSCRIHGSHRRLDSCHCRDGDGRSLQGQGQLLPENPTPPTREASLSIASLEWGTEVGGLVLIHSFPYCAQ